MSAPYKVREFTATSGNACRLKVYPIQPSGSQPIDASWEEAPSDTDMRECDEWYGKNEAPESARAAGLISGGVMSTKIEDPDLRERAIRSILGESN